MVLVDASKLGKKIKEGKNQKTVLSELEESQIIDIFTEKLSKDDFSAVVSYEEISAKNYSLTAGQYFDVKIEYEDISEEHFLEKLNGFKENLNSLFEKSHELEDLVKKNLSRLEND